MGLGFDYVGALLVLDHLYQIGVVLLLLLLAAAVGWAVLSRADVRFGHALDDLLFATATGTGILATGLLALGAVGGFRGWVVVVCLAGVGLTVWRELFEISRLLVRNVRHVLRFAADSRSRIAAAVALLCMVCFLVALAAAPTVDWDSLMYHLRVPSQFLQEGGIHLPADNLHLTRVGLVHLLYVPLLAAGADSGPALLSAAFAVLLGLSVFACGRRLLGRSTAGLGLILVWGSPAILLVAVTPRVDVSLAFFLFLAHYAVLLALVDEDSPWRGWHLALPAALLGFAAGVKYLAFPYLVGLSPLMLWLLVRGTGSLGEAARCGGILAAAFSLAILPWLAKNHLLVGAPLYPFFSERVVQPWLVPLIGARQVPASVDPALFDLIWRLREPFNLLDAIVAPERITIEAEGSHYFLNPVFLLLPGWLVLVRNRVLTGLAVPALLYLLVLILPFPGTNLRYLIPAAVPLTLVSVHVLVVATDRIRRPGFRRAVLWGAVMVALLPSAATAYRWLSGTRAVEHLAGTASDRSFVEGHFLRSARSYGILRRVMEWQVPRDGRVLMLFEARGYGLDRRVLQDNLNTNWPLLLRSSAPTRCLAETGITHVLLGRGALRYYLDGGLDPELVGLERFQTFARRCLVVRYEGPSFVLYRVRAGPTATGPDTVLPGILSPSVMPSPVSVEGIDP